MTAVQNYKTPIFVFFTPENYERNNPKSIHNICFDEFESSPDEDMFYGQAKTELMSFAKPIGKAKLPDTAEAIAILATVNEAVKVLTEAVKNGRNLYEALTYWINGNNNMTGEEKLKALEIGTALAKEMSFDEVA